MEQVETYINIARLVVGVVCLLFLYALTLEGDR